MPNPSFETYSQCPNFLDQLGDSPPWSKPTGGSPDYYNTCAGSGTFIGVPANDLGNQAARTGNAYAGFILRPTNVYREYIEVPLASPLVSNVAYQVSFYVSLSDESRWAVDKLGAYLSVGSVGPVGGAPVLPYVPQIANPPGNFITSKTAWTLVTGTYVAAGGEDHLVIGNFSDNNATAPMLGLGGFYTGAYYYIDDVSVTGPGCESPDPACHALLNPTCPDGDLLIPIDGGVADDFCLPTEPAVPGPDLAASLFCTNTILSDFDNVAANQKLCHTMTGLPSNIGAAVLEIRLRPTASSGAFNDSLNLQLTPSNTNFEWSRRIGSDAPLTGLLGVPWTPASSAVSLCLDLSALPNEAGSPSGPTTNILPQLSATGRLDIHVQDDTAVDHVRLWLAVCPVSTTCEPLPDGSACRNVACPNANELCKPIEMIRDPSTGQTTVTKCDCLNVDQCSLVTGNHGLLFCDGVICPTPGVTCPLTPIGTLNLDGTTTYDCCRGEPPREEACCLPDGTCANLPVGECTNRGGTPLGSGTFCTTPEACCDRGGACVFRDPLCCVPSFSPEGPGTICQGVEACCLPDGTCREMDARCCSGSGLPLGSGSLCAGDSNGDGIEDSCCDVGPGDNVVIDLTTGTLDAGGLIPLNGFDDTWSLSSQPPPTGTLPRPAVVVTPSTAWAPALPNSQWISASPGFGVIPGGPPGTYCYESCFCLHDGFHNASLSFSLRADNSAFVYLNNFGCKNGSAVPLILTDSSSFNSPNPTTFPPGTNVPFVAGENCIEVRVNNANLGGPSATGFNMTGQVTADDARCCCEPLSSGFGCENVECLDARERCLPTVASYDPCDFGAGYTTLDCECRGPNQCRLVDGPTGPTCVGSCPSLKFCTLQRNDPNGDGVFDYSCGCGPPAAEVGDVDRDGDVDLFDHALLQNAFTGPSE